MFPNINNFDKKFRTKSAYIYKKAISNKATQPHHRTIDRNTRMGRQLRVYLHFWREKVGDHHPHIASVGTLKEPGHRQAHSQKKKSFIFLNAV